MPQLLHCPDPTVKHSIHHTHNKQRGRAQLKHKEGEQLRIRRNKPLIEFKVSIPSDYPRDCSSAPLSQHFALVIGETVLLQVVFSIISPARHYNSCGGGPCQQMNLCNALCRSVN